MMPLPEIELHRTNKLLGGFCDNRIPPHARDQVRMLYKINGSKVILIESRPHFQDPSNWLEMPIAQFEYSAATKAWSLYGYDRNDKRVPVSKGSLEKLTQEVDQDPTGIFWG